VFGSEDEEGDAGLFGEVAEAVPGRGGDLAEFFERIELEVEDEEGEIAIVKKEVGAADGFLGIVAANPEEAGAGGGAVRSGVEGVAPINEAERFAGSRGSTFAFVSALLCGEEGSVSLFSLAPPGSLFVVMRSVGRRRGSPVTLKEFGEDEGEAGGGAGGREFGEGAGREGGELRRATNGSWGRFGLMRFGELLLQLLAQGLEIRGHRGKGC
jgi:hypothetical protein